jgi:hypothetical protein
VTATGKTILFAGRIEELLRLIYPAAHAIDIADKIGVQATICTTPADFAADNEVIDAINERGADDRQAVVEAPFTDGFSWPGYEYLKQRRDEILSTYKEATPEAQQALIEELAEIETRLG